MKKKSKAKPLTAAAKARIDREYNTPMVQAFVRAEKDAKATAKNRHKTLKAINAAGIPKHLQGPVARFNELLEGDYIHDPIVITGIENFFLGTELQKVASGNPTLGKSIEKAKVDFRKVQERGTKTTRENAKARESLLRGQFVVERKEFPDTERPNIIRRIRTHFSDKQKSDHKAFWVNGRSYGLSDSAIEKACAGLR